MTDRETFLAMLKRAKLGWKVDRFDTILLTAKEGNIDGYTDFVAAFQFDSSGALKTVDIYE